MATTTQKRKALAAESTVWYKDAGRRKSYFLVSVAILSSATNGYDRMGSGFSGLASPLLITELAHPIERAKVTNLYNTMYYFGAFLGGWITYGTPRINSNWAWRLPSLMQAAPSALQVGLVLLLPESPRWLVSRGRDDEAFKIWPNITPTATSKTSTSALSTMRLRPPSLITADRADGVSFSAPLVPAKPSLSPVLVVFSHNGLALV